MSGKQPLAIKGKIRDCNKNQPPRKMSDIKQNFFLKSVGNYCLNKISKHHTKNTEKYASTVAKICYRVVKNAKNMDAATIFRHCIRKKQNFHNNRENTKNAFCFTQNFIRQHVKYKQKR